MEIRSLTDGELRTVNNMYEVWKKENKELNIDSLDYIKDYVSRCEYCGDLFDYELYSVKLNRYNTIVHCCDDCKKIILQDNAIYEEELKTAYIDYQIDKGLHSKEEELND